MDKPFQLDLASYKYTLSEEFEQDAREYFLFESFSNEEILQLFKLKRMSSVMVSIVRYRLGKILNDNFERYGAKHSQWAQETFGLSDSQNRRLRRHARNISERVAKGEKLRDLVTLPTLAIRDIKTRQDQGVQRSLDALRGLRDDLDNKIVTK